MPALYVSSRRCALSRPGLAFALLTSSVVSVVSRGGDTPFGGPSLEGWGTPQILFEGGWAGNKTSDLDNVIRVSKQLAGSTGAIQLLDPRLRGATFCLQFFGYTLGCTHNTKIILSHDLDDILIAIAPPD